MVSPLKPGSEPRMQRDGQAEDAANKVRRSAEIQGKDKPTETEKHEAAKAEVEAHAELERKEHNRGHPSRA